MGLFDEQWKSYVGLLFDEVKVKEDLVYDKNTGELVGYVDLDSVGNQILEIEKLTNNTSSKLAKFMLVLMVRGVTTSLKFPFAAFATTMQHYSRLPISNYMESSTDIGKFC